jgi:dihydrofolate reductase
MDIKEDEEVFVIGGAKVLWALRPQIKRVYFTRHRSKQRADITLNADKYFEGFTLVEREVLDELTLEVYERQ